MNLRRLRPGDAIASISAIALFVFMFFGWYEQGTEDVTPTGQVLQAEGESFGSAWESFDFTDIVLLFVIMTVIGLAVVVATQMTIALPAAPAYISLGAGLLAVALILYRLIDPPAEVKVEREPGAYLGLIAAGGIVLGGLISRAQGGEMLPEATPPRPDPERGF